MAMNLGFFLLYDWMYLHMYCKVCILHVTDAAMLQSKPLIHPGFTSPLQA